MNFYHAWCNLKDGVKDTDFSDLAGAHFGHLIPTVLDIDPFHRGDFCRQSGARCAAVPDTASGARAPLATKSARPSRVGQIGPPGALWRLPDVPHRAARHACPAGRFAAMKWVNIKEG